MQASASPGVCLWLLSGYDSIIKSLAIKTLYCCLGPSSCNHTGRVEWNVRCSVFIRRLDGITILMEACKFEACKVFVHGLFPELLHWNPTGLMPRHFVWSDTPKLWCSYMINPSCLVSEVQFCFAEITANEHLHCKLSHWHWALLIDLFVWDCFWREVPEEQVTSAERTQLTRICIYKHK